MYFLTSTVLIGQLYPPQPITSLHHRITASPRHRVTTPPHHRVTASLRHRVTALVVCLAPCHQASQSFALLPATKPVSHLPCPLPPHHCVTTSPRHRVTMSPCHRATASPRHCISQSFALPPATKPVSHLPCPLPPRHHITASPRHHVTASLCHCVTASRRHRATSSPRHRATASLPQIFPTTWVWIWLVNANQHSSDWLIVPTTANQITGIEKPNYHKTLIFSPPPLWNGHMKPEPRHHVTASPRHHISQSFALPPATKPVSHLPCPLPPNQSVICLAPYHCVTALVSHLPCPLPPSQSVICLAPCHQTSQSFALPPTTASPHHCITAPPHHCLRFSPPHGYESDWLMLTSTVLIG